MYENLKYSLGLIPKQFKISYFFIITLNLLNSILEMLGLFGFYYFLKLCSDPNRLDDKYFIFVKGYFPFLNNIEVLGIISLLILVIIILRIGLSFLILTFNFGFIKKLNIYLSKKIFYGYLTSPYSLFLKKNTSTITMNIWAHAEQVVIKNIMGVPEILGSFFTLLCILIPLIVIETKISIFIIIISTILFFLNYFFIGKKLILFNKNLLLSSKKIITLIREVVEGIKTIKVFSKINFYNSIHSNNISENQKYKFQIDIFNNLPKFLLELIFVILIFSFFTFNFFSGKGLMDFLPTLGLFAGVALRIMPGLNKFILHIQLFRNSLPSLYEIKEDYESFQKKVPSRSNDKKINFNHSILLDNISLSYSQEQVLTNITININKASIVGLVGESGSGKSSILNILLGLVKPSKGSILIDKKKIEKDKLELSSIFSYVPQTTFISETSIRENLTLDCNQNQKFSDQIICDTLKKVNLLEKINSLPKKLETKMGERGIFFSGGELQRLAIARCLLYNKKIIILDEPTSSIDKINEAVIKKTLNVLKKSGITIIIVEHNIKLLSLTDKIYILKNGEVLKSGTYKYLLKNSKEFRALRG